MSGGQAPRDRDHFPRMRVRGRRRMLRRFAASFRRAEAIVVDRLGCAACEELTRKYGTPPGWCDEHHPWRNDPNTVTVSFTVTEVNEDVLRMLLGGTEVRR